MLDLIIFLSLLTVGYLFGRLNEQRHYRAIKRREAVWLSLPATSLKKPLMVPDGPVHAELVCGCCVISVDYFKRIAAPLRQMFGGNVMVYETLVDRARREAVLRLKQNSKGAREIVNLRLETSAVSQGQMGQVGAIEVHAYGTAIYDRP